MTKLVMTSREKVYFQKLPKDLRVRIAQALEQPELIPPDGRTLRSEALRAEKEYSVRFKSEKKSHECTLEQAAALVGYRPVGLANEMDRLARGYGSKNLTVQLGRDEVTVVRNRVLNT